MIKWAVAGICLALGVLGMALAASLFVVAFYLWLAPHLGAAAAAAITGLALLAVAACLSLAGGVIMRRMKRRPGLLSELRTMSGLATQLLLLRGPKKALLSLSSPARSPNSCSAPIGNAEGK